jgi:RNA recognition motif-containing protein
LTFWQKILKAVGLYKEPAPPAHEGKQNGPARKAAKKSGRVPGGGRVNQGQGQGQGDRRKPATKGGQNQRTRKKTPPPTKVETPRLYVGNLSYDATEYDLEELFKGVGAVRKVELVYNRHTHKSKGYGFINMANMEEAERAVEVLHDQPFMGRKMIVNGARSKGPNDKTPGGDGDSAPAESNVAVNSEPKQEAQAAAGIPAEEEVHSLAPDKE